VRGEAFLKAAVVLGELADLHPQGVVLGDSPGDAVLGQVVLQVADTAQQFADRPRWAVISTCARLSSLSDAVRLAADTRSSLIVNWLAAFSRDLTARHPDVPKVADFREQARDYVRKTASARPHPPGLGTCDARRRHHLPPG